MERLRTPTARLFSFLLYLPHMQTKIYSVFPGVGKTHFAQRSHLTVLDIDSSNFDKKYFPENYFEYIKGKIGKVDIILITCHLEIIKKLRDEGIEFTLVYPKKELKAEYIERYKKRNDKKKFIDSLSENWDRLISNLEKQKVHKRIILKSAEYLEDIFE